MANPHNQLRSRTFPTEFGDLMAHARLNLRDDLEIATVSAYCPDVGITAAQVNPENVTRNLAALGVFDEMLLKSTNAGDTHLLQVSGIDENYQSKEIFIELQGTTPVSLGNWYRVNRIVNVGDTETLGIVTIYPNGSVGTPEDPDTQVTLRGLEPNLGLAGERSYSGAFTIPLGYTGYFMGAQAFPGKGDEIATSFQTAIAGGVFVGEALINSFEVPTIATGYGEQIPELTDIRIMGKQLSAQGTAPMLLRYTILMVKNS